MLVFVRMRGERHSRQVSNGNGPKVEVETVFVGDSVAVVQFERQSLERVCRVVEDVVVEIEHY